MNRHQYFKGECMAVVGQLFSRDTENPSADPVPLTGKTVRVKIRRGDGDWSEVLGVETMTETDPVNHPGVYVLLLDTDKYDGDINMRFFEDGECKYVGEMRLNLNGKEI